MGEVEQESCSVPIAGAVGDDYPVPLGPAPWTVFFMIQMNLSGHILGWEVRPHHWPEGVVFMKNAMGDSTSSSTTSTGSSNISSTSNSGMSTIPPTITQADLDTDNSDADDDADDGNDNADRQLSSAPDELNEFSYADTTALLDNISDDNGNKKSRRKRRRATEAVVGNSDGNSTNGSNSASKTGNSKRPKAKYANKRRQRSNVDCYWLPICRIDNFYNWRAAVKLWFLWTTSRIRGVPQRSRFGLKLYLQYRQSCEQWNAGKRIKMAVLPYKFKSIKKRLGELVNTKRGLVSSFMNALIDSARYMPLVADTPHKEQCTLLLLSPSEPAGTTRLDNTSDDSGEEQ